jgi:hypothetical protein
MLFVSQLDHVIFVSKSPSYLVRVVDMLDIQLMEYINHARVDNTA